MSLGKGNFWPLSESYDCSQIRFLPIVLDTFGIDKTRSLLLCSLSLSHTHPCSSPPTHTHSRTTKFFSLSHSFSLAHLSRRCKSATDGCQMGSNVCVRLGVLHHFLCHRRWKTFCTLIFTASLSSSLSLFHSLFLSLLLSLSLPFFLTLSVSLSFILSCFSLPFSFSPILYLPL